MGSSPIASSSSAQVACPFHWKSTRCEVPLACVCRVADSTISSSPMRMVRCSAPSFHFFRLPIMQCHWQCPRDEKFSWYSMGCAGSSRNTSMSAPCACPLALSLRKCRRACMTLVLLNTISAPWGRSEGRERNPVWLTCPCSYTSSLLLSRSGSGNLAMRSSGSG